jgi:hypothetical protein
MVAPPNVANAEAQAFLNWAADIDGPPSVRAARSSKRLKVARDLHAFNGITETELGEHEGFHARCALHAGGGLAVEDAIADVAGVPPWFGPAMTAALQPVQDQLNNVQAQMNNVQAQMNNVEARQFNSVAIDPFDALRSLTNQDGLALLNFPDTLHSLNDLNGVEMTAFLNHYGLSNRGSNQEKRRRIKKFIGVVIA